jgi:hypothetical protein
MRDRLFRTILIVLYAAALAVFITVLAAGLQYYKLPLASRPHSEMHASLKPGGSWSHGLGIAGSAMILLLFLYSARKKRLFGLRWGLIGRWLNIHIFFGIAGPLFVTLHSAFKFNGVVSVSYFSMMAVMLSGVFGRYVYMQIPRDRRGTALSLDEIRRRDEDIAGTLAKIHGLPGDVLARVSGVSSIGLHAHESGLRAVWAAIVHDLTLPYRLGRLRRYVRLRGKDLPPRMVREIVGLAREKAVLKRRIALSNSMTRVLHLWHVVHRPFAYVMVVIMFVHIAVTVAFGYRWIF